ncbi:cyclic nucleotide-binding protein [Rhizomonospora bruguierae]|uniref:cyclic nucleotide-binding protein n=1 Tax=Rhizomonospora bruguierae TaxID=1581705 RepID=UPI001BCC05EC|nr:cyclic nucleotide-binding protein [Micromonospora sp. NBRC 107566]
MAVVESRVSVWEALAGRAPGRPAGPAEPGLWAAVLERLNPARARPVLRDGIETSELVSARGAAYVMLRSPDDGARACYLRLAPEETALAQLMDGTRTVARLVAEFARISGRLAPDQVRRVVADLAGNRMLDELPVDAFGPLQRVRRQPWPVRWGHTLLAVARGRRMVLANVDPLVDGLYRYGGKWLFTRAAAAVCAVLAVAGFAAFGWTWWRGEQSVFLTRGSYAAGAAVLLGLNILALACHELGHALATKHAGRRIPAAGVLVYFGIPSVFVDTTDVWMAGRRARMLATAAGPGAGLVLAGTAGLVGLAFPALAPSAFKLAFAWYLNALFNLNPFLALDGYYLLMDWLEVPNLRTRGLSWVAARLRRRPPSWSQLDGEGRLVALYGTLAVLWLVIAVNIGYRVWVDRVAGLTTGLWRAGWGARLLLAAVVAGLAAPALYAAVTWAARRVRRLRRQWGEQRHATDRPRRLDALRASPLRHLPEFALGLLALRSRWEHPRTGEHLVLAGGAQRRVYVVVDGALEARHPDDPGGYVRQRVGAGGVVGLAAALTGAPSPLSWRTAGTTLLSIPAGTMVQAVGPIPGPPATDRDEAEHLFAQTPALANLSDEDRLGLLARSRPVSLEPGAPVRLPGPNAAIIVAAGVLTLHGGTQVRRGTMIGPVGEQLTVPVAEARTHVRLWTLPAVSGLPLLLGAPRDAAGPSAGDPSDPGHAPTDGVHPAAGYPPLAAPPGPPPDGVDGGADRRFERRLWWLVLAFLLLALLLTTTNFFPGPAWAEMPADRALLTARSGAVTVTLNGRDLVLREGDDLYVRQSDRVHVHDRSTARLTFRGGSAVVLCAGSSVAIGPLWSETGRVYGPHGTLDLLDGRALADTATTSGAFQPLTLTITSSGRTIANVDQAWYAVGNGGTVVSAGLVMSDSAPQVPTGQPLTCGDGIPVPPPGGSPTRSDAPTLPVPEPTLTPTPSPTAPGETAPPGESADPTNPPATGSLGPGPTLTRAAPPATTWPSSPVNQAPVITWLTEPSGTIAQTIDTGGGCTGEPRMLPASVVVTDDGPLENLRVVLHWSGFAGGSETMSGDGPWISTVGPIPYPGSSNAGGSLKVWVTATDGQATSSLDGTPITVADCRPVIIG